VTPLGDDEDRLDAFHDESPVRYRCIDSIIGEEEHVPGQAQRVLPQARRGRPRRVQEELQFIDGRTEPRTFAEAEQNQTWRASMKEEIDSIQENHTWELAELSRDRAQMGVQAEEG
jgi:hypothetical protein